MGAGLGGVKRLVHPSRLVRPTPILVSNVVSEVEGENETLKARVDDLRRENSMQASQLKAMEYV